MLGKLIKNEFINRGKRAASIIIAFLCLSLVVALMGAINEYTYIKNDFFRFSYMLIIVIFSISEVVVVSALLIGALQDFGQRFFKDQGYLTHTLQVKVSSLMLARMVFDLVLFVAIAIIIPLSICIAVRDFSAVSDLFDSIRFSLERSDSGLEASIVIVDVILTFVAILIYALSGLWMFNASYAIGHAFNNAKRLMSVVAFCVIGIINWIITYIVGYLTLEKNIFDIKLFVESTNDDVVAMVFLIVIIAVSAISVAIYAFITSYVCKKRLNLE